MTKLIAPQCNCRYSTSLGEKKPETCKEHGNLYVNANTYQRERSPAPAFPTNIGPSSTPRRRSKPKRKSNGFKTSPVQQRATKGRACIVCGKDDAEATIDPAHVTPRRMAPHCTCEKGTVPLCREHHEAYDQLGGGFDLLPYLMALGLYEETVHGFLEHGVALREVMDTVTGVKWAPKETAA